VKKYYGCSNNGDYEVGEKLGYIIDIIWFILKLIALGPTPIFAFFELDFT
jgi:hypothetical protein